MFYLRGVLKGCSQLSKCRLFCGLYIASQVGFDRDWKAAVPCMCAQVGSSQVLLGCAVAIEEDYRDPPVVQRCQAYLAKSIAAYLWQAAGNLGLQLTHLPPYIGAWKTIARDGKRLIKIKALCCSCPYRWPGRSEFTTSMLCMCKCAHSLDGDTFATHALDL